jgi:hypothetical protein
MTTTVLFAVAVVVEPELGLAFVEVVEAVDVDEAGEGVEAVDVAPELGVFADGFDVLDVVPRSSSPSDTPMATATSRAVPLAAIRILGWGCCGGTKVTAAVVRMLLVWL